MTTEVTMEAALRLVQASADKLRRDLIEAEHDAKRLEAQLGDALDEVHTLRDQLRVKDQLIEELQALGSGRRR